MARAFLFSVTGELWQSQRQLEGEPLSYIASNSFLSSGIELGSYIYVVTLKGNTDWLLGRIIADEIVSYTEAKQRRGEATWNATEHIFSLNGTPMRFNRAVAESIARQLQLEAPAGMPGSGSFAAERCEAANIDRLSPESASLLEQVIYDCDPEY